MDSDIKKTIIIKFFHPKAGWLKINRIRGNYSKIVLREVISVHSSLACDFMNKFYNIQKPERVDIIVYVLVSFYVSIIDVLEIFPIK